MAAAVEALAALAAAAVAVAVVGRRWGWGRQWQWCGREPDNFPCEEKLFSVKIEKAFRTYRWTDGQTLL